MAPLTPPRRVTPLWPPRWRDANAHRSPGPARRDQPSRRPAHHAHRRQEHHSAEVIAEAPCCTDGGGILPLADFTKVSFTGATVDGSPIGNFNPVGIDMVSVNGVQEDSISSLTSGENFSATWLSGGNSRRGGPCG